MTLLNSSASAISAKATMHNQQSICQAQRIGATPQVDLARHHRWHVLTRLAYATYRFRRILKTMFLQRRSPCTRPQRSSLHCQQLRRSLPMPSHSSTGLISMHMPMLCASLATCILRSCGIQPHCNGTELPSVHSIAPRRPAFLFPPDVLASTWCY